MGFKMRSISLWDFDVYFAPRSRHIAYFFAELAIFHLSFFLSFFLSLSIITWNTYNVPRYCGKVTCGEVTTAALVVNLLVWCFVLYWGNSGYTRINLRAKWKTTQPYYITVFDWRPNSSYLCFWRKLFTIKISLQLHADLSVYPKFWGR